MKINIKSNVATEKPDLPPVRKAQPKAGDLMSALVGAKTEICDGDRDTAEAYVDIAINFANRVEASPTLRAALSKPDAPVVKQSTRLLKYICQETGYTVRITAKWAAIGAPICPINNKPMVAA